MPDKKDAPIPSPPKSWRERHNAAKARALAEQVDLGQPKTTENPPTPAPNNAWGLMDLQPPRPQVPHD